MTDMVMPHVRGCVAQLHAKPGEHFEHDKLWAYRVEVYLPDRGEGERSVLRLQSFELLPAAYFYSKWEAQRALTKKAEELMALMHKMGGAKPDEAFVLDLKSGKICRLGRWRGNATDL